MASPALASTYTMNLTPTASPVIGTPMILEVTGIQPPPDQYWALGWLSVVAIPAKVVSTCPVSAGDGSQVAASTGGAILAIATRPNLDPAGNYVNQVGLTPTAPGTVLLCGYIDDGEGLTLATASLSLSIPAAGTGGAAKPKNLARPRITRSGNHLTCSRGRWSGSPTGWAYGWFLDGYLIKNAKGPTLVINRAARGHRIKCGVGASNAAGATAVASKTLRVR
jgi:hypothetical protein